MPEGDTVWLTAARLRERFAGTELTGADLRVPRLATVELAGRGVRNVVARGKHILTRLDGDLTLHSHLRMDGAWHLYRAGDRWRGGPAYAVRAVLRNAAWQAVGYRVHDLAVVRTDREDTLVGHLGPDLLGPDWDPEEAVRRLAAAPDREIGQALLDQRTMAGVGNLYKSETLFLCGITPWTRVRDVGDLRRIVDTAHRLLRINRDRPEQRTTDLPGRERAHWVYQRGGRPCLRCGTPVATARQGAPPDDRGTYWCPTCQTGPTPTGES